MCFSHLLSLCLFLSVSLARFLAQQVYKERVPFGSLSTPVLRSAAARLHLQLLFAQLAASPASPSLRLLPLLPLPAFSEELYASRYRPLLRHMPAAAAGEDAALRAELCPPGNEQSLLHMRVMV